MTVCQIIHCEHTVCQNLVKTKKLTQRAAAYAVPPMQGRPCFNPIIPNLSEALAVICTASAAYTVPPRCQTPIHPGVVALAALVISICHYSFPQAPHKPSALNHRRFPVFSNQPLPTGSKVRFSNHPFFPSMPAHLSLPHE